MFIWGAGADGQLGLEDLDNRLLPTLMSVLEMDGMEVTILIGYIQYTQTFLFCWCRFIKQGSQLSIQLQYLGP